MIPILDPNVLIYIPYPRVNCLKTIPFTAAHTYISHIGLYKTPNKALSCLYGSTPLPRDIHLVLFALFVVLTFELVDQTL